MNWHAIPKGDDWRRVTPASMSALDQRLWLRCGSCGHDVMAPALELCEVRGVPTGTPLLSISYAVKVQGEKVSLLARAARGEAAIKMGAALDCLCIRRCQSFKTAPLESIAKRDTTVAGGGRLYLAAPD